jgi:tripartite-type tricarboxylate transporter receptor subunit TctC
MNVRRREFLRFITSALATPVAAPLSWGETWPTRPIRAVVPILAGSGVDVLSRLVLNDLSIGLGQPVVIENRPGASGTIGAAMVAKADADGYTILTDSSSHTVVPSLFSSLPYDPVRDFAPVVPLGRMPFVVVCAPSKSFKTLHDLVSVAKASPGTLSYASGGIGTTNHLAAERFGLSAGFRAMHVPYRGAGFNPDLLSGRIDFAFAPLGPYIQWIRDGQLIALAVASRKRAAVLPNVSTTLEAGYANSDTNFWVGMFAPAKTPRTIVERLNQEIIKAIHNPTMQEKFARIAAEPMIMSPSDFEEMLTKEYISNAALAKSIGLTAS